MAVLQVFAGKKTGEMSRFVGFPRYFRALSLLTITLNHR